MQKSEKASRSSNPPESEAIRRDQVGGGGGIETLVGDAGKPPRLAFAVDNNKIVKNLLALGEDNGVFRTFLVGGPTFAGRLDGAVCIPTRAVTGEYELARAHQWECLRRHCKAYDP